jgi:CheY-like chemotaxis protein
MRILVIEDDPVAAQVIERILRGVFTEIKIAATMHAAIQLLRDYRPDVAVVDLRLPDSRPEETLEQVVSMRDTHPEMQIHIVTGAVNPDMAEGFGATSILHKLDMPRHLRARILDGITAHLNDPSKGHVNSAHMLRDTVSIILESSPL